MEHETKKSEKGAEFYLKRQLFYQKLHTVFTFAILAILLVFSVYFIEFAGKAKVFMDETKQTLKVAAEFFETANDKLDVLDMENVNGTLEKTNDLMENVDEIMEKTEGVLKTVDHTAEKAKSVVNSVQNVSGVLDGLKEKAETIGGWMSKLKK